MRGIELKRGRLHPRTDSTGCAVRHRPSPGLLLFALVFALVCTACASTSTPPTTTTTAPATTTTSTPARTTKTQVVFVAPVNSHGQPVKAVSVSQSLEGSCNAGSDSVGGPVTIYRCFAKTLVADPCWAAASAVVPTKTVLCMSAPWSTGAVKIVTAGLPVAKPAKTDLNIPWGVELTTGQRCLAAQGAHESHDGFVVDYYCGLGPRKGSSDLALLRGLDRDGPLWDYRSVELRGNTFTLGQIVQVKTAFYGGA